jgi:predicted kinase
MPVETSTIRVPRRTRDLLAQQARERGVPLARLLTEMAEHSVRASAFASEREATRHDASVDAVRDEDDAWDGAAGDGIE